MQNSLTADDLRDIYRRVEGVEGWLTRREVNFLATAAARPTAAGSIVELGTHKGKSTIAIAMAARHSDQRHFATVDPMFGGIRATLDRNLADAHVVGDVDVYAMLSDQFIASWDRSIRFLFHDGCNEVDVVRRDLRTLRPFFSNGALIVLHDVLNASGYRAQVYAEEILNSDHFGPVGFCGSIGWGQYFSDPSVGMPHRAQRARFQRKLARLLPLLGKPHSRLEKIRYKFWRSWIPHHHVNSSSWLRIAA